MFSYFYSQSKNEKILEMNNTGPVLIVDDDQDDRELIGEIFRSLNYTNPIFLFADGQAALDYLLESTETPFLILSDINMPRLSGPQLRDRIEQDERLSSRYIPFIFFTTSTTKNAIVDAYSVSSDGFFIKPSTYKGLEDMISKIYSYWSACHSPADYA